MDASFNLLGCVTREASSEEKPCVGVNDWCLEASEVYEYGLSLNNSLYRSRVLLPMKLLHSMRLSEMGYVEACVAYLEELRESVRASRVTNESFIQQLELLENRVRQSEKEWECVECVTRRQGTGKGGFLSQLFTVVDKGINSFMTAVEEKEEVVSSASSAPVMPSVSSVPSVPAMPSAPVMPSVPSVPAMPSVPSIPAAPVAPAMPSVPTASSAPAMPAMPAAPAFTKPAARAQHPHGNRHARNSLPKPFVPYTPPESVLQPAQPQPLQPVQPQPSQPIQPIQPIQPLQPAQPIQPLQPVQPIQPPQPTQPSEPVQPPKPSPTPAPSKPTQPPKPAEPPKPKEEEKSSSWSLFGSLFGRSDSSKKVYKVELPKNEAKPYYDEVKKKWIIPGVEEEEEKAPLPPPPPMEPAPQPQPEPEPEPEPEPQAAPPMPAIKPFVPATVAEEKEETSQEPPKTGRRRFGPM